MTHRVQRIVRDELSLAVAVEVVGAVDGRPPGLAAPVAVGKEASGTALGDGGEDHGVTLQPVDVTFEGLQSMGRERDFPTALGTLRILLDAAAPGVDLHHEQARAALIDAVSVQPESSPQRSPV